MKYQQGDIIKLRNDLVIEEYYGSMCYTESIARLVGKPILILKADEDDGSYKIQDDEGYEFWITDGMIKHKYPEKLIDLLNMMSEGVLDAGTKILYKGREYVYRTANDSEIHLSFYPEGETRSESDLFEEWYLSTILNDKIEIVEDPSGIDFATKEKIRKLCNEITDRVEEIERYLKRGE